MKTKNLLTQDDISSLIDQNLFRAAKRRLRYITKELEKELEMDLLYEFDTDLSIIITISFEIDEEFEIFL